MTVTFGSTSLHGTSSQSYHDLVDAEADAEGAVRVAEAQLAEARDALAHAGDGQGPRPPASVVIAAEEALARAVRQLQRCRDATVAFGLDGSVEGSVDAPADVSSTRGGYDVQTAPDRIPQYTNVADWVEKYLLRMWRRQNVQWCAKWFLHGEAISRLEALWRSWEHLRWEGPTAMAIWWRDYADYHLRELTAKTGPFEGCHHRAGEHQLLAMLSVDPAPQEMRVPHGATPGPAA